MAIVNLEKDIKIRTFSPRHGFDPLTASPRDWKRRVFHLVRHNLALCPHVISASSIGRRENFIPSNERFGWIPLYRRILKKGSTMGAGWIR